MPNYDSLGPFQYIRALQKTGLYHMVISFIYFLFILSLFYFVRVILFALDHSTSAGVGGWGVFALVFTTHINFFDPYFMVKFRFRFGMYIKPVLRLGSRGESVESDGHCICDDIGTLGGVDMWMGGCGCMDMGVGVSVGVSGAISRLARHNVITSLFLFL